ncbi:hypothetical protein J5N97_016933 [Dioscorea zingiberensis]|uniref:EF-hand domain-containing protein n=1 Tax=Dioscorea zingiberensis TaxID=325984 RepID=A0A9D5CKD1_9LILI|nr:hypothetical protein J5N97_016933 [Dioscorea zingiberensis]
MDMLNFLLKTRISFPASTARQEQRLYAFLRTDVARLLFIHSLRFEPSSSGELLLRMSKLRVLNFMYNLSKKLPAMKMTKWLIIKDRQSSDLLISFQPNIREMRQVFDKIDSNGDGKISLDELQALLKAFGKDDPAGEAKEMMLVADTNKDGYIDFSEFMEVHRRGIRTSDIKSAFWMFDQDGDGRISAEEVRLLMVKLGEHCSLEDCRRMVRQVDKNSDGLVDMDDFMAMMTSTLK